MSKFEEYDLYSQNKEFLVSDRVITFTDTTGKLMALKPDVTLSIVKNTKDEGLQRLYYNENVYRISESTNHYKEIMQAGLECIGELDLYNLYEVVYLAARSLQTISEDSVLNISHLGVLFGALEGLELGASRKALFECIGEKNAHGVEKICDECKIDKKRKELLVSLAKSYGEPKRVIDDLRSKTDAFAILSALDEFETLCDMLKEGTDARICADLSLVGDINYYNGIIFRGYINGIPSSVLTGGQYDSLMKKMGKKSRAIGFAVYLDLLQRLEKETEYDVDVLLLCDKGVRAERIANEVKALTGEKKSVSVHTVMPERLRYRELIRLSGEVDD
jgi:ATP phosphoribosyltransferase regulatory subunit